MSIKEIRVNKPEPIAVGIKTEPFKRGSDIQLTIESLEEGRPVLITEFYNNGLALLKELKVHLKQKFPDRSFLGQRAYRSAYHELSNLVVIEITDHQLVVKKSPKIGWLAKLYPENGAFLLSFPQIQGLNSAWQWYENGISIPVLRNKIHPWYGTYFPTRFDHLVLFDNWLKRYPGPKKSAIEVGVGSGVLALQMVQQSFQKVFTTDINPNAIVGLAEFMGTTKLSRKIELDLGHLFGKWEKKTELIVFNPPWLPQSQTLGRMEDAIYYNAGLFPDFFAGAQQRLLPEGKLVLLFSNLAQITEVTQDHPIEKELAEGGRFQLEKKLTKNAKAASQKTKRDLHWRDSEIVELWVLRHMEGDFQGESGS